MRTQPVPPHRRAFTMVELLVVIVLIAVVSAILLPTVTRLRTRCEGPNVKCSANLVSIYKAMYLYSNDNKGNFPRTLYVPDAPPSFHWDAAAGGKPVNPFADKPWADYPNDVTMAIFLILRTQDITTEVFTCPIASETKDMLGSFPGVSVLDKASFSSPANLSYSFANMYADKVASREGYKWNNALSSEFVIAADMNPGLAGGQDVTLPAGPDAAAAQMRKANSLNHNSLGQVVLFGDGHTEFAATPFQGMKRDNIYTVAGSTDGTVTTSKTIVGSPAWSGDTVLLPTRK